MDNITAHLQREKAEIAIALSGAMLSDQLIDALADTLAGKSAADIRYIYKLMLPPESSRFGIQLPYFVADKLSHFPIRARDLVMMCLGTFAGGEQAFYGMATGLTALSKGENEISLFSPHFYTVEGRLADTAFVSPVDLKLRSNSISDAALWSLSATVPSDFGSGYSGNTPLKGNIAIGGMSETGSRLDAFNPDLIKLER